MTLPKIFSLASTNCNNNFNTMSFEGSNIISNSNSLTHSEQQQTAQSQEQHQSVADALHMQHSTMSSIPIMQNAANIDSNKLFRNNEKVTVLQYNFEHREPKLLVECLMPGIYLTKDFISLKEEELRSRGFNHIIIIDKHIQELYYPNQQPDIFKLCSLNNEKTKNRARDTRLDNSSSLNSFDYYCPPTSRNHLRFGKEFDVIDLNFGEKSYLTTVLPNCYKAVKFINKALQTSGTILVIDCNGGEQKCLTIIVAYLMYKYNINFSMNTVTATKRSRASAEQLLEMADFMMKHPGLAGGKMKKLHGKLEFDKMWRELAESLNCLGGANKAVNQWQTVWKELKSRTSTKVRDRKRQQALTGNKPLTEEHLSELEKRVIAIIGNDYIEGSASVSENIPMEEDLQILLEEGQEYMVPSPTTEEVTLDWRCETPSTSKKTPNRRLKRKRAEDDVEAKRQFLEIANKQADALKILAECSASTIENNKIIAESLKSMGDGLKEIAAAVNNLANVVSKINAFARLKEFYKKADLDRFYISQLYEYEPILQVQRAQSRGHSCSRDLHAAILKRKKTLDDDEPTLDETNTLCSTSSSCYTTNTNTTTTFNNTTTTTELLNNCNPLNRFDSRQMENGHEIKPINYSITQQNHNPNTFIRFMSGSTTTTGGWYNWDDSAME